MALTSSVFKYFIPSFTWTISLSLLEGGGGGGWGCAKFQNQQFLKISYQEAH